MINPFELTEITKRLMNAFNSDDVKRAVLDEKWYRLNIESKINTTGFCFAASEVIYRLAGGKEKWFIKGIRDPEDWSHGTHYFLESKKGGEILDITESQYVMRRISIPYHLGRARGLQNISKKARSLAKMAGLGELS